MYLEVKMLKFPFIFDGGMGTYYQEVAKNPLPQVEMANIFQADVIYRIHREYINAGAMGIKTNTYQANKFALSTSQDIVVQLVRQGIEIAKKAAGDQAIVFGNIGNMSAYPDVELEDYYDLVDIFVGEGIDHFLLESFTTDEEIGKIGAYIKEKSPEAYLIGCFSISPDGSTRSGYLGDNLIKDLAESGYFDAVGFNCVSGPHHLREYMERIELPENVKIIVMPNAGYPTIVDGRTYYNNKPDYFANTTLDLLGEGVDIVGGCCGTNPEYIKKLKEKMPSLDRIVHTERKIKSRKIPGDAKRNYFREKLESGAKPIAVEYDPPEDMDIAFYMNNAQKLGEAGVDAITIADVPVARARIDAALMGFKIKNELGIDPIVHLTCRDRNINATKAILMGLNIEDIFNLILVTGDPIPSAEKDEVKGVFQFNSTQLANYVTELNNDLFLNPFNIGGALNINAPNFEAELKRAKRKEEMGMEVFYTQPVISQTAVENLKMAYKELEAYIMGGIFPVVSYRNAIFMNAEVPGITVADDIVAMYEGAETKEENNKLAVDLSCKFMKEIRNHIDGYYIITPFNRVDLIEDILECVR